MNADQRKKAEWKAASATRCAAGLRYMNGRALTGDIEARLAEIPRFDTRDLTARLMGDPLPERSALAAIRTPSTGEEQ